LNMNARRRVPSTSGFKWRTTAHWQEDDSHSRRRSSSSIPVGRDSVEP
jgi:hypothetical protein